MNHSFRTLNMGWFIIHIFDDLPLFSVYFCLKICLCSAVAISRFLSFV